jgi:hypothetical protein
MKKLLTIVVALAVFAPAASALASTPYDWRGTWQATSGIPSQTWTISTLDQASGTLSGEGTGGGYTWPITGTASGGSVQMHFPYRETSYTAEVTGTISADCKTITGTYDDNGDGQPNGSFTVTRTGEVPAGGCGGGGGDGGGSGDGGGGNDGGGGQQAEQCQNPTTLLVTCASGDLRVPGVCGPSFGTILPACNIPTVPPTVCGPSLGVLTQPCQIPQPEILACGGFGTVLPQCRGANSLALACGPQSSVLPACNFTSRLTGAGTLDPARPDTIDLQLSCPVPGARASTATAAAHAAADAPTCNLTVVVEEMRTALMESLAAHAADVANQFAVVGRVEAERREEAELEEQGTQNQQAFAARARAQLGRYLVAGRTGEPDAATLGPDLAHPTALRPFYAGPGFLHETNSLLRSATQSWADALSRAVVRLRAMEGQAAQGSRRVVTGAARTRLRHVKRVKVRAGKRRHVKVKLPKRVVKALVKNARKSKRSKRFAAVRFVVVYRGKLEGRTIPVARLMDVRLKVKKRR